MAALPPFPWLARRERPAWCRTALARGPSLQGAVDTLARQLAGAGPADLALVFVSASYASDLPRLLPLLRRSVQARHWIGCLGGGVVGTGADGVAHELEGEPAVSLTLLHLPGAEIRPFHLNSGDLPDLDGPAEPWRRAVAGPEQPGGPGANGMLLLVDPSCGSIQDLVSGLDFAFPGLPKLGGIAGQHSAPHGSLLFCDGGTDGGRDRPGEGTPDGGVVSGAVGCLIGGAWRLEPIVAQGCRPIGPVFEVEQAQRNVLLQVSQGERRRSPVEALQGILGGLNDAEREQVKHSLFLGVVPSSFSFAAEAGAAPAFLVRNLIGVDPRNGAVAVGERMRVGQKVQFQLRDGEASREESRQLLSHAAGSMGRPLGALLFACLGRGQALYGHADGDVGLCRETFAGLPIAGVFCNGEIGPVAGGTHLHGYTACWAFLVPEA